MADWSSGAGGFLEINGSGTLTADVTNAGTVTIGASFGGGADTIEVNGDYSQTGGTTTAMSDLQIDGTLSLSGGSFGFLGSMKTLGLGSCLQTGGDLQLMLGTLQVAQDFRQQGGTALFSSGGTVAGQLNFDGGTTTIAGLSPLTVSGGVFVGSGGWLNVFRGTLAADVSNAGTINLSLPSGGPESATIQGNLTQTAAGTLQMGLSQQGHDSLNVTGTATLDGAFVLLDLTVFPPTAPYSLAVLSYGSRVGTFASCSLPTPGSGSWEVHYDDLPFPSAMSLWLTGGSGMP